MQDYYSKCVNIHSIRETDVEKFWDKMCKICCFLYFAKFYIHWCGYSYFCYLGIYNWPSMQIPRHNYRTPKHFQIWTLTLLGLQYKETQKHMFLTHIKTKMLKIFGWNNGYLCFPTWSSVNQQNFPKHCSSRWLFILALYSIGCLHGRVWV